MEVKDKVKGSSAEIPKAGGMVQVKRELLDVSFKIKGKGYIGASVWLYTSK